MRATFGAKRLDEIDEDALRGFARFVELEKCQPKGPVNFARTLLREAAQMNLIKKAPSVPRGVIKESKKLPEAPTLEMVETIIASAKGWLKIAVAFGVYAGLRSGEIRAMQVGDVDLGEGVLRVRRTLSEDEEESPKGDKERSVPIVPQLAAILAEAVRGKPHGERLIVTAKGTTPCRQAVLARLVSLQVRLGTPRAWSVHALRHASAPTSFGWGRASRRCGP